MFLGNNSLIEDIKALETISKINWMKNEDSFFDESISVGANIGDINETHIWNSVNIGYRKDDSKKTMLIYRSNETQNNRCHVFPYNSGEVCPGFCIVPISEDTIVITEKLSGCEIYIYDIKDYRIYVHFEKKQNSFQFENQKCKDYLAMKIYDTQLLKDVNIDGIKGVINNPLIKIVHKDYNRLNELRDILKEKYNSDSDVFCEYSPIIHQKTGEINIFFFPNIYINNKAISFPEGNLMLQIKGTGRTEYSTNYFVNAGCCNII